MKKYFQKIIGKPKSKKALRPDLNVRRVEHSKPISPFERKVLKFKQFIFDETGEYSIHSGKLNLTTTERASLRKKALKHAGLN